jgi:hypothetical protein
MAFCISLDHGGPELQVRLAIPEKAQRRDMPHMGSQHHRWQMRNALKRDRCIHDYYI